MALSRRGSRRQTENHPGTIPLMRKAENFCTLGPATNTDDGVRRLIDVDLPTLLNCALERRLPLLKQWHEEGTDCYRLLNGTAEGLPGAGGWFDVRLPRIMLRGNPAELRMDWIDFYRG